MGIRQILRARRLARPICDPDGILTRENHIASLQRRLENENPYDVVIVGGGCVGAATALEAASRGLSAVVLEAEDFGGGSTKMTSGGVTLCISAIRSLDLRSLILLTRGINERHLKSNAGRSVLASPVPMIFPLPKNPVKFVSGGLGAMFYGLLGTIGRRSFRPGTCGSTLLRGSIGTGFFTSAWRWPVSCLIQETKSGPREVIHTLLTASQNGLLPEPFIPATIINRARVIGFQTGPEGTIQKATVRMADMTTLDIPGRSFILCTGPKLDETRRMAGFNGKRIGCRGIIHLSLPKFLLGCQSDRTGLYLIRGLEVLGRLIPSRGSVLASSKPSPAPFPNNSIVTDEQIRSFSRNIGEMLHCSADIIQSSVQSANKSFEVSIPGQTIVAKVHRESANMWSVVAGSGAPLTWLVRSALAAVDPRKVSRNRTNILAAEIPSRALKNAGFVRIKTPDGSVKSALSFILQREFAVNSNLAGRLVEMYGFYSWDLLFRGAAKEGRNMGVNGCDELLISEIDWAVEIEMAQSSEDVLMRRNGIAMIDARKAAALLPSVNKLLSKKLHWSRGTEREDMRHCATALHCMGGIGVDFIPC